MTTQKFQIKALTALYQNSSDVRLLMHVCLDVPHAF